MTAAPAAEIIAKIRPLRAVLIGLHGERAAVITLVVADEIPKIVMFNGDPFLIEGSPDLDRPFYFQQRPFRADVGE